jgi:beta-glucosidase
MAKLADQKQIFFLNINARFFNKQKKLPPEIMPDFLHPNERGYRVWAEAMEPTLKRLMAMPSLK